MKIIEIKEKINQWKKRQLLKQVTHHEKLINIIKDKKPFYCGFDPTAKSLHFGHFLLLNLLFELKKIGCQPIVVLGTTTAKIGDPSFRTTKRTPLSKEEITTNKNNIKNQILTFIEGLEALENIKKNYQKQQNNEIIFLENDQWLEKITFCDFLIQVGDLFTVNKILQRQSLKEALQRDGLFYSDLSYILLQAYDFYHLYQNYDCHLQIGGSDQFPNLVFGTDLISKKISKNDVCALTTNLLTNSKGQKISKSIDNHLLFHSKKDLDWNQKLHQHLHQIKNKKETHVLKIEESLFDIFPFFWSLDDQTITDWNIIFDFQKYFNSQLIKKNWHQWSLQKQILWWVNKVYYFIIEKSDHSTWSSFDWFTFFWNNRHKDDNQTLNQFIKLYYCFDKIKQQEMITQFITNNKLSDYPQMVIKNQLNLIPSLWITNNQKWSLLQILTKLTSFNKAKKLLQNNDILIDNYKVPKETNDLFAWINKDSKKRQNDHFVLYCGKNKVYFVKFIN